MFKLPLDRETFYLLWEEGQSEPKKKKERKTKVECILWILSALR